MNSLYIECKMGVAGDMLMAALLELTDKDTFLTKMNSLGLPGVTLSLENVKKNGITGTHVKVLVDGREESENMHDCEDGNASRTLADVKSIINNLDISDIVKSDAISVYNALAEAESEVHGTTVSNIHFHEVGTIDAITDIVGVCILMEMLSVDKVIISSINVGSGEVKTSHGILPVPAPATALLLRRIPMYTDEGINGELCTPTGAALIRHFTDEVGDMPVMATQKIGYGFGSKEFDRPNCVRVFLGEECPSDAVEAGSDSSKYSCDNLNDTVVELRCNIDDMTPEDIGYAQDKLLKEGANDVFTTPIYMKKNRPGILLTVICNEETLERTVKNIFKYTTTIGIRKSTCDRYILDRKEVTRRTKYGDVRVKESSGYGIVRTKPEYEDIVRLAEENDVSPIVLREEI